MLLLCTEDEVLELLHALDTSKANGPDNISAKMLKSTAVSIASVLTKLLNLSITTGKLPSEHPLWYQFQKLRTSPMQRTTDLSRCSRSPVKSWRGTSMARF